MQNETKRDWVSNVLDRDAKTQPRFEPKYFYSKKWVNYDKCNLRQNSVKGPKDPNSATKKPKVT